MTVAAAGRDDVRVGDGDPVEFEPDDRVGPAAELTPERGQLHLALSQGAVGEQQLGRGGRHADH
jgi:hypothetical protein